MIETGNVIIDIEGLSLTSEDKTLLSHPKCGGLILFARQDSSPEQIHALCKEIRQVNPNALICVDQEGGRVQRFKSGFTRLPEPSYFGQIAEKEGLETAKIRCDATAQVMAEELRAVGVDISFAPVVDRPLTQSQVLQGRTFSTELQSLMALAQSFIQGMHAAHMPATLKHFPGHGGVELDSHLELPIDTRDMLALQTDLQLFKELFDMGAQSVMTAHIIFPAVDSLPVTFSKTWLQDILRQQLNFQGIVFSDDLSMKATDAYGDYADRTRLALEAGCDYVLVCNNRAGAIDALEAAATQKDSVQSAERRQYFSEQLKKTSTILTDKEP